MSVEYSGNVVVAGDADKVYEFIQKYESLPYSYEPWENGGYDAITFFRHNGDFLVDFWRRRPKKIPNVRL